jgi:hypothetical protein
MHESRQRLPQSWGKSQEPRDHDFTEYRAGSVGSIPEVLVSIDSWPKVCLRLTFGSYSMRRVTMCTDMLDSGVPLIPGAATYRSPQAH